VKSIIKKTVKILTFICVAFLLIYNITLVVKKISNPSKIPDFLGYKNFVILSGSMEGALNIGDIIFVKETKKIKKGDIISYRENQAVVTHRVVNIISKDGKNYYQTKGDANPTIDTGFVSIDEIEGYYCFKIPKIGKIVMFFQTKTGIIIFFVLFLLIYLFKEIIAKKY